MEIAETPGDDARNAISKYVRLAASGVISHDEFMNNVFTTIVASSEADWPNTLTAVPGDAVGSFRDYVADYLERCHFRPSPAIFLADMKSEERIEKARTELEPRYKRFLQLVQGSSGGEKGAGFFSEKDKGTGVV